MLSSGKHSLRYFDLNFAQKYDILVIFIAVDEKMAKFGDFRVSDKQVPQVDTKTHDPESIIPWIESIYKCILSKKGYKSSFYYIFQCF